MDDPGGGGQPPAAAGMEGNPLPSSSRVASGGLGRSGRPGQRPLATNEQLERYYALYKRTQDL